MLTRTLHNAAIAVEALTHNKTRALLTSLGIIFGVASVIAMLAIGKGAEQEILQQIRLLGANNVIVTPVVEQEEGSTSQEASDSRASEEKKPFSPGLTLRDAESIARMVPGVDYVSPETVVETVALRAGLRRSIKLVGVETAYFEGGDFELAEGNLFTARHLAEALPVCIIGYDVRTRFFAGEEALGKQIKAGNLWMTVVGVLKPRNIATDNADRLGLRNFDLDVYTPLRTLLHRYEDRARLTADDLRQAQQDDDNGAARAGNYHQLDRLTVRVERSDLVGPVADVVSRMLERRHYGVVDYEVIIPEQLLKQERRTQTIFNVVLAAIASISLVVGGIGIMNIMLASVMERIREIGVRRSLGATRRDVIEQFLIEAIAISFTGGLLGIALGVLLSVIIEQAADIITIVSGASVALSFIVSVTVGLVFGLLPAKRAAQHDPVVALRHE